MTQHPYDSQAIYLLNHASLEEIDKLPGLSSKVAEDVYQYCQKTGVVQWDDLHKIENISEQRLASLRSHFITKASSKDSTNSKVFWSILDSWPIRLTSLIGTVFLFIFAIIEGVASFQGARDIILGTPTPIPPICRIVSDNGASLVPIYANPSDTVSRGLYGSLRPPTNLRYLENGTVVDVLRDVVGSGEIGTVLGSQQTLISRYQITANYDAPLRVVWVQPSTVAYEVGFQHGDRIMSINGVTGISLADYLLVVTDNVDQEITFSVERYSNPNRYLIGIVFDNTARVQITGLLEDGPAELAGVQIGDIILAINGEAVVSSTIANVVTKHGPSGDINLTIQRGDQRLEIKSGVIVPGTRTERIIRLIPSNLPPEEPLPVSYARSVQDGGIVGLYLDDKIDTSIEGYVDSTNIDCYVPSSPD